MGLTDSSNNIFKIILILWPEYLVVACQHEHFDWSVGGGSDRTTCYHAGDVKQ
jgi:hypothetical protein